MIEVVSELAHDDEEGNHIIPPDRQIVTKRQRRGLRRDGDSYSSSWGNRCDSGSSRRDGIVDRERGGSRSWDQLDLRLLTRDPDPIP